MIPNAALDQILRFHLMVDADARVVHAGPALTSIAPNLVGRPIGELVDPNAPLFDLAGSPSDWVGRMIVLALIEPSVTLRGEFLPAENGQWLFAACLDPVDTRDLGKLGLQPNDFAPSDLTYDFSMLRWSRDAQVRETRMALLRLQRTNAEGATLRALAHIDTLTGIASRNRFLELLDEAIDDSVIEQTGLAVVTFDIARFKSINDLNGHAFGDRVLVYIAERLQEIVGSAGTVARLGGDEFAALITSSTMTHPLERTVADICESLSEMNETPTTIVGRTLPLRLTIGVAFHSDEPTSGALLRHADIAMNAAKRTADTAFTVFNPDTQHDLELRRSLAEELAMAIENHSIEMHFQPIVDLATRRAIKFEVLSRWTHPVLGAVPPSLFFEVAEQIQLVHELDRYVIHRALKVASERLRQGGEMPALSVNVSALSLTDELVEFIRSELDEMGYPPHRLCIELTETSSIKDMENTSRVLGDLDALGISVALDDFGTGFSSLTYLHQLPIGSLKIDRSFVADMLTSRKALELVRSILEVARSLDLPVVAEGIETIEQCVLLQNLGCDEGQGYFFAHPASAEAAALTVGRLLPFNRSEVNPTLPPETAATATAANPGRLLRS